MLTRSLLVASLALVVSGCGASVPRVIREEMTRTSAMNRIAATIVFFTDFQCPFCRRTHAALAPLIDARHSRVRLVLRHIPLRQHPDARTAARAAICVEALTPALTADYAHALFSAPDLSEAACEEMAIERGVDRSRFEQCLASPLPERRLGDDEAMFDSVGGDGVPLLYIGSTRLDGAQTQPTLASALDDALERVK